MTHSRRKLILIPLLAVIIALSPVAVPVAHAACNFSWGFSITDCVMEGLSTLASAWLGIFATVLAMTSFIFDFAIYMSITKFGDFFINNPGVKEAWKIARDVCNLFFIFVLLYIAIATVLQLNQVQTKRLLAKVIVVALLINFSGVLTRVVIDASNVFAYQFYVNINTSNSAPVTIGGYDITKNVGLTFWKALRLDKYADPGEAGDPLQEGPQPAKADLTFLGIITHMFGGTILLLVTSFVLLAGAVLFMIRSLTLTFLFILSPLAIFALTVDQFKNLNQKWWKKLLDQALFAPAYLFIVFIVLRIIQSSEYKALGDSSFKGVQQSVQTTVFFIITIGLMIGSILVAKAMSAYGMQAAMKFAGGTNRMLTRGVTSVARGGARIGARGVSRFGRATGISGGLQAAGQRVRSSGLYRMTGGNLEAGAKKVWESKAFKENVRQGAIGRGVKDFTSNPLQTVSDKVGGMSAVVTGVDVGFMGDTDKARREAAKAAKEQKEVDEANKVKLNESRLGEVGSHETSAGLIVDPATGRAIGSNATTAELERSHEHEKIVREMKDSHVAKMDTKVITNENVAKHLDAGQLNQLDKAGNLKSSDRQAIKDAIEKNYREIIKHQAEMTAAGIGTTDPRYQEVEKRRNKVIEAKRWMNKNIQF